MTLDNLSFDQMPLEAKLWHQVEWERTTIEVLLLSSTKKIFVQN
jgi:hypothetical protein